MGNVRRRACGGCTACCFTHPVASNGVQVTTAFDWCKHCTAGSGCAVYEERPSSCAQYQCMWSSSDAWPEWMRPDRWGVVVDAHDVPEEELILVYIFEYQQGRYSSPEIQKVITGFVDTGKYAVMGHLAYKSYDFRFPAHVSEEEKIRFVTAVSEMHQKRMAENPEVII